MIRKNDKRLLNKLWRINHLYFIKDKKEQLVQFKLNPAQNDFFNNAWFRNVILKSRQLGFTTLEVIDMLDDTLFVRNKDSLLVAQNLDTAKDIFDNKVYLAWDNFRLKQLYSADMESARRLKVGFGDNTYSSMTVDTSGRAGTYHRLHITELAKLAKERPDRAKEIVEGSIPAVPTDGRVDIESTSEGAGGLYYDIFNNAWGKKPKYKEEFKAHFYNWFWDEEIPLIKNPEKNLPQEFIKYQELHKLTDKQITYYFRKWLSLNRNSNSMKKEYPTTPEEAFEAIIEGVYYRDEITRAKQENRIKEIPYDEALKVHTVWDLGIGKNLAIGFYQRMTNETRMIDYWEGESSEGIKQAAKALQTKPYLYGKHFAPHDIRATEISTGKTRIDTAKSYGIKFNVVPEISVEDGIDKGRLFWSKLWIDKTNCERWLSAMSQYRQQWDDKKGMFIERPFKDWTNHKADVHRYASLVEEDMTNDLMVKRYIQKTKQPRTEFSR